MYVLQPHPLSNTVPPPNPHYLPDLAPILCQQTNFPRQCDDPDQGPDLKLFCVLVVYFSDRSVSRNVSE